jgi:hypothetical protein
MEDIIDRGLIYKRVDVGCWIHLAEDWDKWNNAISTTKKFAFQ